MLAVLTLVVFGCAFASAQTFGFGTAGGDYLYCNYEAGLNNAFGSPFAVWAAVDNLSACGHSFNATMVGIAGKLSKVQNPAGFALSKGVTMADNLYDAYSYGLTGAQWDVTQNGACTNLGAKKVKEGWIGFASESGFVFGDNYGVLACSIPSKGKANVKGLSIGNAKHARK
jgi:hypothetical protein